MPKFIMGLWLTRRIQVSRTLLGKLHFNRVNSNTHLRAQNPHGPVGAILQGESKYVGHSASLAVSERLQKGVGPSLMSRNSYDCSQENWLSEADDLTCVRGSSQSGC